MTVRLHEALAYKSVRVTRGPEPLREAAREVLVENRGSAGRRRTRIGILSGHLKSGGNRSGIPSLISYRWLHCLQESERSRISSFSTSTRSSRSPLHTGQHKISMRSRFIPRGNVSVRLKPIALLSVRGPFQKPLVGASHRVDRALREFRQCLYRRSLMGATSRRNVESWTMGKAGSAPTCGPPRSS